MAWSSASNARKRRLRGCRRQRQLDGDRRASRLHRRDGHAAMQLFHSLFDTDQAKTSASLFWLKSDTVVCHRQPQLAADVVDVDGDTARFGVTNAIRQGFLNDAIDARAVDL